MIKKDTIVNAGNTEVPCYLAIRSLGFSFDRINPGKDNELWVAENENERFVASNQLELMGLIYMKKIRGGNWKANGEEIDRYLTMYYPEALE